MAVRSYRRYRRPLRTAAAPISASFTATGADAAASQVKMWNEQLQLAKDKEALQALADGHSDAFLAYAQGRANEAAGDDKAYWTGLLAHAREKIADDTIVAQVSSGEKSLEDLQTHLQGRLATAGEGDRADVLANLAKVKNGILARDFNKEATDAQATYLQSGDSAAYLEKLSGMLSRATDPKAQQALAGQVGDLRKEITDQQVAKRSGEANRKIVDYYNEKITKAEILPYLADMAATASSPEEANRYASLAAQIDTRERTLQRQALSDAVGGGTRAVTEALGSYRESYSTADAALVQALRSGSVDRDAYNAFQKEAEDYLAAIRENLHLAPNTQTRKTMTDALNSIGKNVAERQKQFSAAIVHDVQTNVTSTLKDANTADSDLASQFRFLASQQIREALGDPLLSNQDSKATLQKELDKVASDQQAAVRKQAAVISGTTGNSYRTTAQRVFNTYQDFISRNANDQQTVKSPGITDYNAFLDAADAAGSDVPSFLASVGLGGSQSAFGAAAGWLSDLRQARAAQDERVSAAQRELDALVAPRGDNGLRLDPTAPFSAGGARWNQINASGGGYPDAFGNVIGGVTKNAQGQDVMGPANSLNPKYGTIEDLLAPPSTAAAPPAQNNPFDLGGFLGGLGSGIGGFFSGVGGAVHGMASEQPTDPHEAAYAWLDSASPIDVPNYAIPPLPDAAAFAPAPTGSISDLFMPPAPMTPSQSAAPAMA